MPLDEQTIFLNKLAGKIKDLVEKEFEKCEYDPSFHELYVETAILNQDFDLIEKVTLLDTARRHHYCAFCRQPTFYYQKSMSSFICASCLADLEKKNEHCKAES